MPAIRRTRRRPLNCVVVVLLAVASGLGALLGTGPAGAAPPALAGPSYVKYYIVTASYAGAPENLSEIAERFLGSATRSSDVLQLNAGVAQPDGGKLADAAHLHAGWVLTLPWDAAGTGVRYGIPPGAKPATPLTKKPSSPPVSKSTGAPAPPHGCATLPKDTGGTTSSWGMLRVAPDHAWAYSRGGGVMVAVVDSGVDASLPELAGHVSTGADVITGTGRGDVDCLGTGTAMAGIIAARSDSGPVGVAPDATVMPVRIAPTTGTAAEADQASGIQVAVSAGAKVIALGGFVDPSKPAVARAIALATSHDVVVVAGPQASGSPLPALSQAPVGLLQVGAISIDGAPATAYGPGVVDVVAPGVAVNGLGINGTGHVVATGAAYAVAFVAGEAALVRAMYPQLTVAQVVRRIEATADRLGPHAPDATFGWGLIDPGAAVTRIIPDEGSIPAPAAAPPGRGWSSTRTRALLVIVLLALVMLLVLVLRIRRMVRAAPLSDPKEETEAMSDESVGRTDEATPAVVAETEEELVPAGAPAIAEATAVLGATAKSDVPASHDAAAVKHAPAGAGSASVGASVRQAVPETTGWGATTLDAGAPDGAAGKDPDPDAWWRHGATGG